MVSVLRSSRVAVAIPFWLGLADVAASRVPLFSVETELSDRGAPCCRGPQPGNLHTMWITSFLLPSTYSGAYNRSVVRT